MIIYDEGSCKWESTEERCSKNLVSVLSSSSYHLAARVQRSVFSLWFITLFFSMAILISAIFDYGVQLASDFENLENGSPVSLFLDSYANE